LKKNISYGKLKTKTRIDKCGF